MCGLPASVGKNVFTHTLEVPIVKINKIKFINESKKKN